MTTKRTPIARPLRAQFSPEALDAFEALRKAEMDDEWWARHRVLHRALGAMPWQYPCAAPGRWANDTEWNAAPARAMWRQLASACRRRRLGRAV